MSEMYQLPMFSSEDFHVKTFLLQEIATDWLDADPPYGSNSFDFLNAINRAGLSSKMSPVYYPPMAETTSEPSFQGWSKAGIASHGGFWTLNISESPNAADVCLLSEVLEADAPPKYYLSPTAAKGILRRSEKEQKDLPQTLLTALKSLASSHPQSQE